MSPPLRLVLRKLTKEKLEAARAEGDDKADILADSLVKLEDKLAAAQQTLSET